MTLARWSPLLSSMARWPSIWEDDDFSPMVSSASNSLDVFETQDEVVVRANVAGVKPEDVAVTFEKGTLWITAERKETEENKDKKRYSSSEWKYSYTVRVPGMIDQNAEPTADVEDGVLEVRFAKAEASKPRQLQVKARNKE